MSQPTRVSVGSGGTQANHPSIGPAISGDGRWVAFASSANNLVPDDTNDTTDVFLHDRQTATTIRVSSGPEGVPGDNGSYSPSISADGRLVAFDSMAGNLVAEDTNHAEDVFVYDRQTGITRKLSVGPGGAEGNTESDGAAISADGRWVAFNSIASNLVPDDTNGVSDIFVHDRQTGITTRVNLGPGGIQANDWTFWRPVISGDGRYVAFQSYATNLVDGDSNGHQDVFLHDRQSATTRCLSVGPGAGLGDRWSEFPAISDDGRWVVFESPATNLVAHDSNGYADVFLYDVLTGALTRASVGPDGVEGNMGAASQAISADGRWVAFGSWASNLVADDTNGYGDVFVFDRLATTPVAPGGLVVDSMDGNLVTVRWTTAAFGPAPTDFVIEGGSASTEIAASVASGSTTPMFSFVAPAGSYYVRVHAVNGAMRSAPSNELQIHVNAAIVPSAPAHLLGLVNGSTLALTWTNTYAGGAPTSFVLEVTGALTASLPVGRGDSFALAGVPEGTYTLALRAVNATGTSAPSNAVTLTFPGPCSGAPDVPRDLRVYRSESTVHVAWAPGASGPAPTAYVLIVTGSSSSSYVTAARAMSGAIAPGTYALTVVAVNACGASAGTPAQTVVVP
jgi:Tol biopolymer transport system component